MQIVSRDRDTQRVHCYVSPILRQLSGYACHVRQGAGHPSTGNTDATVSIFLGRDSEARKLRAKLGGNSLWQATVTTYYVKD